MGLFAPAGTPADIVSTLEHECETSMRDPQLQSRLLQLGLEPAFMKARDFMAFLLADFAGPARSRLPPDSFGKRTSQCPLEDRRQD